VTTRERSWFSAFATGHRGWRYASGQSRYGRCGGNGRVVRPPTFDESLLSKSGELQDYVIVHELLHVSVPNHGKLWKSLMRAHLGDYETYEEELRTKA
jgi:predicted metal-dependent hydrolase